MRVRTIKNGVLSTIETGADRKSSSPKKGKVVSFSERIQAHPAPATEHSVLGQKLFGSHMGGKKIIETTHPKITNCWKQTYFPQVVASFITFVIAAIFMSFFSNGVIATLQSAGGVVGFIIATVICLISLVVLLGYLGSKFFSKNPKPVCPNGADMLYITTLENG